MSLHTADGSVHRRPSRPVCVSRSRSTTAHSSLMIASTSASGVPHGMTTLPMSRAQFRLPTDLRFGCFRDHALCNGLRLLSCAPISLLRAMTSVYAAYNALLSVTLILQPGTWLMQSSRLPWYWILPHMFSPSSMSRGRSHAVGVWARIASWPGGGDRSHERSKPKGQIQTQCTRGHKSSTI